MTAFFRIASLSLLMTFSGMLSAAMIVERTVLHYQPGSPSRQDVEIRNPDEDTLYIQVDIYEVINPGSEDEERRLVTNPRDANFLVTPNRLAIPPGGRKLVRLVNLQELGEKERIFRVSLKPVIEDVESEQTAIKVLVGYQLLVLIQPAQPSPELTASREGNVLTLTNNGNTNILLHRGQQCAENDPGVCVDLPVRRLYPGNVWQIELEMDTPVQFVRTVGTNNQTVVY